MVKKGFDQVFSKFNNKYPYLDLDFDDFLEHNYILNAFVRLSLEKSSIIEFINHSYEKYVYEAKSTHLTLAQIYTVRKIEPLLNIIRLFETNTRLTKKTVDKAFSEVDDEDFELKEVLFERRFFENLFSVDRSRKEYARKELISHLKRLIEYGQPASEY